jgi:AraC family transcriptional regulator
VVKDGRPVKGWSQPGLVTIIPPMTPIVWDVYGEVHSCTLHLPPERFEALVDDTSCEDLLRDIRFEFAVRDPFIAESISLLINELRNPTQRGPLYADALGDAIAMHLLQHHAESHIERTRAGKLPATTLAKVCGWIESRIADGASLEELARIAGMSRSQFTRAFRLSTGTSAHRYLLGRRIERAKEELQQNVPMVAIALSCGFSSQSHFTNMFRRVVGVSPAVYRRSCRTSRSDDV